MQTQSHEPHQAWRLMDEVRHIRGRRVVFEREPPRGPVEHLRYSLDVYDDRSPQ